MIFKKSKGYQMSNLQKMLARDFDNNSTGINQDAKKDLKKLVDFAHAKSEPSEHDALPLDSNYKEYSHMLSNLKWLRDCKCLSSENGINDINNIIDSLESNDHHMHCSIHNIYDFLDDYWIDVGTKMQTYRILYDLVMMSQWEPRLIHETAQKELYQLRKKYDLSDNV